MFSFNQAWQQQKQWLSFGNSYTTVAPSILSSTPCFPCLPQTAFRNLAVSLATLDRPHPTTQHRAVTDESSQADTVSPSSEWFPAEQFLIVRPQNAAEVFGIYGLTALAPLRCRIIPRSRRTETRPRTVFHQGGAADFRVDGPGWTSCPSSLDTGANRSAEALSETEVAGIREKFTEFDLEDTLTRYFGPHHRTGVG